MSLSASHKLSLGVESDKEEQSVGIPRIFGVGWGGYTNQRRSSFDVNLFAVSGSLACLGIITRERVHAALYPSSVYTRLRYLALSSRNGNERKKKHVA